MLEIGKLYSCEEYFLLLFPDKETGARADAATATVATVAYWSREFGKPVGYVDNNVPLLILNTNGEYIEVLAGDRKGWIVLKDWLKIKEIK